MPSWHQAAAPLQETRQTIFMSLAAYLHVSGSLGYLHAAAMAISLAQPHRHIVSRQPISTSPARDQRGSLKMPAAGARAAGARVGVGGWRDMRRGAEGLQLYALSAAALRLERCAS